MKVEREIGVLCQRAFGACALLSLSILLVHIEYAAYILVLV